MCFRFSLSSWFSDSFWFTFFMAIPISYIDSSFNHLNISNSILKAFDNTYNILKWKCCSFFISLTNNCGTLFHRLRAEMFELLRLSIIDMETLVPQLFLLQEVYWEDSLPEAISTDRELSIINVISKQFAITSFFVFKWDINKNVVKTCKKHFSSYKV